MLKIFSVFLLAFFCLLANASENSLKYIERDYKINDNLILPKDLAIGNTEASVVIIDYSSFSCVHCQHIYKEIFLKLKKDYIDTGKVLLILRDFPLDSVSFKSSLLLKHYENIISNKNTDTDKLMNLISKLFDVSITVRNPDNFEKKLYKIANEEIGMTKHDFDCVMNDTNIKNQILHSKLNAIRELKIRGTPTIYINGENYRGSLGLNNFKLQIDKIIGK